MRGKFCISSTASFHQINKAPTNTSATKQTFSFSKGNRFQNQKPICPLATYGGDFLTKKASGTAIGYGNRSDFTKCLTVSPSSSKYNLKTFWDENKNKKKGAVFALSRDKVAFNSYISSQQMAIPPPTQYNSDKKPRVSTPKYTLRERTSVIDKKMTIDPQNTNPGPGSYINPQIQSQPSFKNISKFQVLSYGQNRSRRFDSSETITPGPGKYKQTQSLPKNGKYLLSQNKGGTKAKFDSERRQSFFDKVYKKQLDNPGPGYYQAPSQFGQYDGDIYNELRKSKRSQNGWVQLSQRKNKK